MSIGIGIDTGGTYTDAVIYDFDKKEILASAKALTTKENLSVGISKAIDGLPDNIIKDAEIISLSTTLATNACVEDKGGRAKLLFIGVDKNVVQDVGKGYGLPNVEEIYFVDSESNLNGEILKKPDWESFYRDSHEWFNDADAVGIVEIYAMKHNAILEKEAKEIITGKWDIPTICGHDLFSDLNSIQRGSSTLLNARLIPVIEEFLKAIKIVLDDKGIHVPVVISRSDGSLMSEQFTSVRPVETLVCGPASSVMGGIELTEEKDSLIIDMGGTTTDISMVKDGVPVKAKDGINVGKWRTFVKGVKIDTFGLGGDSAVRFNNRCMVMDQKRVVPLSIIGDKYDYVNEKLEELVSTKHKHTLLLHEFFSLVKDISNNSKYTQEEREFCKALEGGPLIFTDAAKAVGKDIYNFNMERLEREGIVIRCGLTPTDIMHIKGDFDRYDSKAAKLAVDFVSSCIEVSPEELVEKVYDTVKKTLYINITRLLLEDQYPAFSKTGLGAGLEEVISESWEIWKTGKQDRFLDFKFNTPATLIGIGAPIHIFLPDVAKALGTKCIIPEHAGVANALGALVGNIMASCEIEIKPQHTSDGNIVYIIFGKSDNRQVEDKDEAIKIAIDEAREAAKDEAINRGAVGDITITSEVIMNTSEARDETEILFGITAIATAVGRITL